MNQTWLKRASALVLSATMAASLLPVGALAAGDQDTDAPDTSGYTAEAEPQTPDASTETTPETPTEDTSSEVLSL